MVSFCVASEAEAIVPELMVPPLICIAALCAPACLAVTPLVCGKARTSPTTRPVPTRNPVSATRRLRISSSPPVGRAGCFQPVAAPLAAHPAEVRHQPAGLPQSWLLLAGLVRSVVTPKGYAALRRWRPLRPGGRLSSVNRKGGAMHTTWMNGWDWLWMTLMMGFWLVVLGAVIYIGVRLAHRSPAQPRADS